MVFIITWILMLIIVIWQSHRLDKEEKMKELKVFWGISIMALLYSSLVILNISTISPLRIIILLIEKVWDSV